VPTGRLVDSTGTAAGLPLSFPASGRCPRTPWFLRSPRRTGRRVFPGTALRRPSPCASQQPLPL